MWLFVACMPFVLLLGRAFARAGRSLMRRGDEQGVATVGLLRPRIALSPLLAQVLDRSALEAALEHERAHVRHRDPLRIWLGQLVSDLQWPWPSAGRRFRVWLVALKCTRDEEARAAGIDGADLAAVSGIGAEPARNRARAELGTIDAIADRYLSQPALNSFGARWPWAIFTLGPLLLLFASLLVLLATGDWLFDSVGASVVNPLRWLALYGLPVGAVGVFATYAARRRLHSGWLFAGGLLVIAVVAAANVDVVLSSAGGPSDSSGETAWPSPFPRSAATTLSRATLMLAWHTLRTDTEASVVLLGITPTVARLLRSQRLQDIDRIAEQHHRRIRPRWEDRPGVWRQLMFCAKSTEVDAAHDFVLHALQLTASAALPKA